MPVERRTPRVSVLMPTYGQAHFIRRALDSLLAQSLTDWELIVVDDGSPDDTRKIVLPYLADPRIRYYRFARNRGLGAALNSGLSRSRAPLIAYLPSDDSYFANHLESLTQCLHRHPDAILAYAGVRHHYNRSAAGQIPGEPLQLVQVMHRRTRDRWIERCELVTDDLERMYWSRLRERGAFVGTGERTCEWVNHPDQLHKLLREPEGGINPYRARYAVAHPLRFHSSVGNPIDEVARYQRFRERPDTPFAPDGLKILLVGCGKYGWTEWDRVVLDGLASIIDFHSIHIYTGSTDYYSDVFSPHQAERAIRLCATLIERARFQQRIERPIRIACDEWNIWPRRPSAEGIHGERYTLVDALAVATYLNIFIGHCRSMGMANLAQLVNVIAPIVTGPDGLFLQPIYHPLWLYSQFTGEVALDTHVDCPTYDLTPEAESSPWFHRVADLSPFKLLDVAATCDASGQALVLAVVNRDRDRALPAAIRFAGAAGTEGGEVYELNAPDVATANSFAQPQAVALHKHPLTVSGPIFDYTFPAHSLTVLRIPLA